MIDHESVLKAGKGAASLNDFVLEVISERGLTSRANLWASLTRSTSIITSSSWVGNTGSFFAIKVSIRWKSSTSYLR